MKQLKLKLAGITLVVCLGIGSAYADCVYNGVQYPTGTKIGDLTCQEDGSWR